MKRRSDVGDFGKSLAVAISVGCLAIGSALAQGHGGGAHKMHGGAAHDDRALVHLPPDLVAHTLANMRDHLAAIEEINNALAEGDAGAAARIAEQRLGLSSLDAHGAHHVGPHMPQAMRDAGLAMHKAASRFAIQAQNADVAGDLRPALGSLGEVLGACNACHAAFRFR